VFLYLLTRKVLPAMAVKKVRNAAVLLAILAAVLAAGLLAYHARQRHANGLAEAEAEKYGSAAGAAQFARAYARDFLRDAGTGLHLQPAHDFAAVMDRETHQWTVTGDVRVHLIMGPVAPQEMTVKLGLRYNSSSGTYDVVHRDDYKDLLRDFQLRWRELRMDDWSRWREHDFKKPVRSAAPVSTFIFVYRPVVEDRRRFTTEELDAKKTSSRGVTVTVHDVSGEPLPITRIKDWTKTWTPEFGGARPGAGRPDQFLGVGCYGSAQRWGNPKGGGPIEPYCDITQPRMPMSLFSGRARDFVVWEIEVEDQRVTRLAIDFIARDETDGHPTPSSGGGGSLRINSSFQPLEPELDR
jgi:hypothetical protein